MKRERYKRLNKEYCATQKLNYYGYKPHAVCNVDGVFSDFDLTQASVHGIQYDFIPLILGQIINSDKGRSNMSYNPLSNRERTRRNEIIRNRFTALFIR